jgi:hypothetical protein
MRRNDRRRLDGIYYEWTPNKVALGIIAILGM